MFNLYFAGSRASATEWKIEENENLRLLSYFNDKRAILKRIENGLVTFVDSGAFSAHTKGIKPDVDDYIQYVNDMDEFVSIFAQLDTIPGEFGKPKTAKQLAEAPELSWDNYQYMRFRVISPDKLLPIYHQGEDIKHLIRMLEHRIPYIGISPANDVATSVKVEWMGHVFKVIKDSVHPDVKTHAFGMTSLKALEMFPFTSADSTSWIMYAANGQILTKYGAVFISEKQAKDPKNIMHQSKVIRDELEKHIGEAGFNIEMMAKSYKDRAVWNIIYMTEWAKNYQHKPRLLNQTFLGGF